MNFIVIKMHGTTIKKTRILSSVRFFFLSKIAPFWDNVEGKKCCRDGQATDVNMAHAHYMKLQKHTQNMQ